MIIAFGLLLIAAILLLILFAILWPKAMRALAFWVFVLGVLFVFYAMDRT